MARGRYDNSEIVDGMSYATYDRLYKSMGLKDPGILRGVQTFEHTFVVGDRLDSLASKYFGDDGYWWVIALINKIDYPLGIKYGTLLRIPYSIGEVLKKILP